MSSSRSFSVPDHPFSDVFGTCCEVLSCGLRNRSSKWHLSPDLEVERYIGLYQYSLYPTQTHTFEFELRMAPEIWWPRCGDGNTLAGRTTRCGDDDVGDWAAPDTWGSLVSGITRFFQGDLPFGKPTWLWKMAHLYLIYPFKMVIFSIGGFNGSNLSSSSSNILSMIHSRFPEMGIPQNEWFIIEHLMKVDNWGVPPF